MSLRFQYLACENQLFTNFANIRSISRIDVDHSFNQRTQDPWARQTLRTRREPNIREQFMDCHTKRKNAVIVKTTRVAVSSILRRKLDLISISISFSF